MILSFHNGKSFIIVIFIIFFKFEERWLMGSQLEIDIKVHWWNINLTVLRNYEQSREEKSRNWNTQINPLLSMRTFIKWGSPCNSSQSFKKITEESCSANLWSKKIKTWRKDWERASMWFTNYKHSCCFAGSRYRRVNKIYCRKGSISRGK